MKGLILSSLAGIFIASVGISYADAIRITSINESGEPASLKITSSRLASIPNRTFSIGAENIKMFTANYTYPDSIYIQRRNAYPQRCDWTMPPVGKQIIRVLTLNITVDKSNNGIRCLLSCQ